MHGLEVAAAAMQEKDSDLLAVGANGNFVRIGGLMDRHADVPLHANSLDTYDVLYPPLVTPRQQVIITRHEFRDRLDRTCLGYICGGRIDLSEAHRCDEGGRKDRQGIPVESTTFSDCHGNGPLN